MERLRLITRVLCIPLGTGMGTEDTGDTEEGTEGGEAWEWEEWEWDWDWEEVSWVGW